MIPCPGFECDEEMHYVNKAVVTRKNFVRVHKMYTHHATTHHKSSEHVTTQHVSSTNLYVHARCIPKIKCPHYICVDTSDISVETNDWVIARCGYKRHLCGPNADVRNEVGVQTILKMCLKYK